MLMRKMFYERPLVSEVETMPEEPILGLSDQNGGLEDYNNGNWNWGTN